MTKQGNREMELLDRKMRTRAENDLSWHRAVNRGRSNRAWEWIVGAVFVIAIILTGYRLVQTQQHLETMQSELENAKQVVDQAKAQATEFAKQTASQREELRTKLDQATSEIKSAQSQLEDTQSRLGGMQSELENAKRVADQEKRRLRSSRNGPPVNARSFRPNWIRPPRRSNQPNPSLRTSSLVWEACRANLRTLSGWQIRQKRRLQSSRKGRQSQLRTRENKRSTR